MIQFNLLPDVKIEYIKARRQKRLVVLTSSLAAVAAFTVLVFLILFVDVVQKKNLHDLNADIKTQSAQLESTANLSKILTVQNQLTSLTNLHDQKPAVTRLFGFLSQLTPNAVTIGSLRADYSEKTLSMSGSASSLDIIKNYVDTLKSTTYTVNGGSTQAKNAFSSVVLSNFSRTATAATYTITIAFDPLLFDQKHDVTLSVPNITDTHSDSAQPATLFNGTN